MLSVTHNEVSAIDPEMMMQQAPQQTGFFTVNIVAQPRITKNLADTVVSLTEHKLQNANILDSNLAKQ